MPIDFAYEVIRDFCVYFFEPAEVEYISTQHNPICMCVQSYSD
jgi:hypothetical protein